MAEKDNTFDPDWASILGGTPAFTASKQVSPQPKVMSWEEVSQALDAKTSANTSSSPAEEFFQSSEEVLQEQELTRPYETVMQDYSVAGTPEHSQFWNGDPNTGYKIHLNVRPENVLAVSEFLKKKGYQHKYLHGGEVSQGKIFTVYTGSAEHTRRVVQEITNAINDLLEEPQAWGEEKYAPKICGRFKGSAQHFWQYGPEGMSLLRDLPPDYEGNTVERAKEKALELYPGYFQNEIPFYVPVASE